MVNEYHPDGLNELFQSAERAIVTAAYRVMAELQRHRADTARNREHMGLARVDRVSTVSNGLDAVNDLTPHSRDDQRPAKTEQDHAEKLARGIIQDYSEGQPPPGLGSLRDATDRMTEAVEPIFRIPGSDRGDRILSNTATLQSLANEMEATAWMNRDEAQQMEQTAAQAENAATIESAQVDPDEPLVSELAAAADAAWDISEKDWDSMTARLARADDLKQSGLSESTQQSVMVYDSAHTAPASGNPSPRSSKPRGLRGATPNLVQQQSRNKGKGLAR